MPSTAPTKKSVKEIRTEITDSAIQQEALEELRGLTLCLRHLSEQTLQYECFSAASYILLAAGEINKTIIKIRENVNR